MLTYININGFKSFHDFEMEFTPFTVVAGANASGKSNLFDALKLLGRLAEYDNLKKAFKEQRGEFIELFTQYGEGAYAREMSFVVEMLVDRHIQDAWGNQAELKYTRLRYELIIRRFTNEVGLEDLQVVHEQLINLKHQKDRWIHLLPRDTVEYWRPKVATGKRSIPYLQTIEEEGIATVEAPQDGSPGRKRRFPLHNATRTVLSSFDTVDFPHAFAAKEEMRSWKFLQLNPDDLRRPTDKSMGQDVVSQSGANLAAALFRIKQEDPYTLRDIARKLGTFLPHFIEVDVVDDQEHKQYLIRLTDRDKKEYSSRVLSEGTLRMLALCILEQDPKHEGLLCFEEPENGVHPLRITAMADLLKDLSVDFSQTEVPLRQVIVNTHSPVLVRHIRNWESDPGVSIWYAEMRKRIATVDGIRRQLSVSHILPVAKEQAHQTTLEFSEQDRKLGLYQVTRYLEVETE